MADLEKRMDDFEKELKGLRQDFIGVRDSVNQLVQALIGEDRFGSQGRITLIEKEVMEFESRISKLEEHAKQTITQEERQALANLKDLFTGWKVLAWLVASIATSAITALTIASQIIEVTK
jgi:predicted  nucleic acid-binding Zn-ribbon protein